VLTHLSADCRTHHASERQLLLSTSDLVHLRPVQGIILKLVGSDHLQCCILSSGVVFVESPVGFSPAGTIAHSSELHTIPPPWFIPKP
jgi:hypothetical protein